MSRKVSNGVWWTEDADGLQAVMEHHPDLMGFAGVDAVTGIDQRNTGLLVKAAYYTAGQRQFPR